MTSFYSTFLNIHRSGVLTALAWLVSHETAAVSAQVLCTPYNHAPCHFMQSHIRHVHVFSCEHVHFWHNERDLLCATAVTRGWNRHRNTSQHRKSTLENKFSSCSRRDSNPSPFNHESGVLTTELSLSPTSSTAASPVNRYNTTKAQILGMTMCRIEGATPFGFCWAFDHHRCGSYADRILAPVLQDHH